MSQDQEKKDEPQPDKEEAAAGTLQADPKLTHVAIEWKYSSPLIACSFDPEGRYVFASAEDNTIQRWELSSGNRVSFEAHDSWVRDITCLPDGQTIISAGCDEQMIWWPVTADKPAPLRSVQAHNGWIRSVQVSPDGSLLASGGNDNLVKLWDSADGTLVHELSGHDSNVYSTKFHPSGQFLLSGDLSGKVRQWEISTGKLLRTFDAKELHTYNGGQKVHYGGVRSISFSPDGKTMACSGLHKATNPLGAVNEPIVLLFEWESQKKVQTHVTSDVKGIGWQTHFLSDGSLVCASGGSGGGFLLFWKPEQDKEFFKFKLPNTARDLDLHRDGLQLATAHYDRRIRISRMAKKPEAAEKKKS